MYINLVFVFIKKTSAHLTIKRLFNLLNLLVVTIKTLH